MENIVNKIKKLLALAADNPNEAESISALEKAQELMAIHKINQSELEVKDPQECIKKMTSLSYGTRSSDHYLSELASIISENFCCVDYISTPCGSRTHYICFMGYEEDVAIAEEALHVANMAIVSGGNKVYRELQEQTGWGYIPVGIWHPAKKGYVRGYLMGLKEALESQKKSNEEWGLVLVVPEEAKEYHDSLHAANFNKNSAHTDYYFYDEGYQDGRNFNLRDKIDTSKVSGRLEG